MSTELKVKNLDVGTRFFGGRDTGVVIQMEVSEYEFDTFRNEIMYDECENELGTCGEYIDSFKGDVRWDSSARQYERLRYFKNHRWAPMMQRQIQETEQRAKLLTRLQMEIVK